MVASTICSAEAFVTNRLIALVILFVAVVTFASVVLSIFIALAAVKAVVTAL